VNSWAYDQIVAGIASGKIKGLWIVATNSSHSWINQRQLNAVLGKLDFLVVQDMYYTTETAQRAHLLLPAAGWGEKTGTFINSERRIGLVKRVSRAPGQALSDFNIFKLIAQHWGCAKMFENWSSPEAVFQILKELSHGMPYDITGIRDYDMIDAAGGVQWPFPGCRSNVPEPGENRVAMAERRLFEDGVFYHADKKAKFLFEPPRDVPELPDREYPFVLLTGRGTSSQWHTQTRTAKSAVLRKLYPKEIYVEISPVDAEQLGIEAGERVSIASRRGKIDATAFVTNAVRPGQVFIPMHYATANELTFPAFDPYSRQPGYKSLRGFSTACTEPNAAKRSTELTPRFATK
jgi:assimilatory nitrate reductase catalytic subunit